MAYSGMPFNQYLIINNLLEMHLMEMNIMCTSFIFLA